MVMKIFGMRVTWKRLIIAGTAAGVGALAVMEGAPRILEAKRMRVSWCPFFILKLHLSHDYRNWTLKLWCIFDLPILLCRTLVFGHHLQRRNLLSFDVPLRHVKTTSIEWWTAMKFLTSLSLVAEPLVLASLWMQLREVNISCRSI